MAYGTHPGWAQYSHGVDLILWSRRLQWPCIAFTLVMCMALLVLIISGKRRAWWLIGLGPILALFVHKFHVRPGMQLDVTDTPTMVPATSASFLADDTYVVGLVFEEQAYAFPYPVLFNTPGVIVQNRDKKMMLIWSPDANRAVASRVDLDVKARDLEVVSTPANSVLLYNSRLGQFIIGVTGKTERGEQPGGFKLPLQVYKTTWAEWRGVYPESQVMAKTTVTPPGAIVPPTRPIVPRFVIRDVFNGVDPKTHIAIVQGTTPQAITVDSIGDRPANLMLGDQPVLILRDGPGSSIRAFDRRIDGDLFVRLKPHRDTKKPAAAFSDASSGSLWSKNFVAVEGGPEVKGKKLAKIPVEEDLSWGVMKFWYKDLQLYRPAGD